MKFENIKIGDKVIEVSGGFHATRTVLEVTGVTAKYFDVGPTRYRKDTGRRLGAGEWSRGSIDVWTQAEEDEINTETRLSGKRFTIKQFFGGQWTLDEKQMDVVIATIGRTK